CEGPCCRSGAVVSLADASGWDVSPKRDFFFSSRRRHTRFSRDWSSDVCSSDLGFASGCSVSVRPVDDEATPTATAGTSGRVGSVRSTPVASVTVTPQPSGDTPVATEVSETPTPTTAGEVPTLPPPPTARPMPTMPPNPAPSPSPTPTARPEPTAPPPVTPTPAGPPV